MSGSIRDLPTYIAGDAFQPLALPIEPEQVVLERYTFLPYVRTGIAASLARPFAWDASARATVKLSVPVSSPARTDPAEVEVIVRGPGDVAGFDARQVVRCYPTPGVADALTEDLAHIELDRPDFPWMFTPTGPTPDGHLVPWVSLVVVPRRPAEPEPLQAGTAGRLPTLTTTRRELPPLSDAWAWAHAQVMGGKADAGIPQRLSPANPAINLARVLCPRRLEANTSYLACLVPTFRAGVEAGLGLPVTTTTLEPAWADGADPDTAVVLPVYHSFTFATGDAGDFKALAERLVPLPAPPGVGRRRLDTSVPGNAIPDVAEGEPGREMVVEGPVVSLQAATEEGGWPSEAAQRWPDAQRAVLRAQLNAAGIQRLAPDGMPERVDEPTVGPPLYAGAHLARTLIEDAAPGWFRELNEDPRNRVVAGVGVRVVEHDQESLMASAWNQVAGVEAANAALRYAQLGRYVGASIHRRHIAPLGPDSLLALTHGVHSRVLDVPGRTVRARIGESSLPVAVPSGAFRRLTRARGPLARFSAPSLAARAAAVGRLFTDQVGVTRSYVRPYRNPDGIDGLSTPGRSLVTDEMVAKAWGGGDDPAVMLDRQAAALGKQSFTDALATAPLADLDPQARLHEATAGGNALERLLVALPTMDQLEADRNAAAVGRTVASQLEAVLQTGEKWLLSAPVAERLGLGDPSRDRGVAVVEAGGVEALVGRVRDVTQHHEAVELFDDPVSTLRLGRTIEERRLPLAGALRDDLLQLGSRIVQAGGVVDVDRDRLRVSELGLVGKLDPAVTVTKRVIGRLTTQPDWLPADWFDDRRVEPVMVAPAFGHPMYEALDRYERSWLLPGVSAIETSDLVTLLATNSRFVEAFLVGLNHEFARELLWREYPTDGRATSFRSFWTRQVELLQDVHAFDPALPLRGHLDPILDGRIVLLVRGELVRRYPGLIAHAAKQAGKEKGRPLFAAKPERTIFQINLAPNLLLVGFDLTPAVVRAADVSGQAEDGHPYWFLLAENPTEPRFGLDDGGAGSAHLRDELTWDDLIPQGAPFLRPSWPSRAVTDGPPPPTPSPTPVTWGADAAAVAHILYQPPARAAFAAAAMIQQATP